MIKLVLMAAVSLILVSTSAFAESQVWNITEVTSSITGAQGQWFVNIEGDNRITGNTNMQFDTGAMLTYAIDGKISGQVYTVNLIDRSDGKKGCVLTGEMAPIEGKNSHRLIGEVHCDGDSEVLHQGRLLNNRCANTACARHPRLMLTSSAVDLRRRNIVKQADLLNSPRPCRSGAPMRQGRSEFADVNTIGVRSIEARCECGKHIQATAPMNQAYIRPIFAQHPPAQKRGFVLAFTVVTYFPSVGGWDHEF